jgi:hypothetical protein
VTQAEGSVMQFLRDSIHKEKVEIKLLRSFGRSLEDYERELNERVGNAFKVTISRDEDSWTLQVGGLGELAVLKAKSAVADFVRNVIEQEQYIPLPESWGYDDNDSSDPVLVELDNDKAEYDMAVQCMHEKGFSADIIRVERVQNPELYRWYHKKRKEIADKNEGDENEALLKHGTSKTSPSVIWNSGSHTNTYGFDFRYSSDNNFYGRGSYFTDDAAYTHNYAYCLPDGDKSERQVFLAFVTQGKSEQKEETDRRSGHIMNPSAGYQSIRGPISGSLQGIVVYEFNQSYPAYLVTYRMKVHAI